MLAAPSFFFRRSTKVSTVLSRRPNGEIFRAVQPGRENDLRASRCKLQDLTPCIPNGFRYEEITRCVKGHAMRISKIGLCFGEFLFSLNIFLSCFFGCLFKAASH